ncbi:unnamed protein product [Cyprideis torosa]|uniref:Uncharacterized protein n=1 Tax=Cyprideis torosa TaxID=163714 RepID=A0A7R8WER1_9CRUS|nr:unnamed protein product [Cyprideis torosa]CAG0896074.1 unnamed protein product [Cyprideis torosa]
MGGWFSRKSRVTDHDRAVLQLKKQRDQLHQYQQRIKSLMDKEREMARSLLSEGKKDRARLLLRKKRCQENLLVRAQAQMDKVEELTHDLEFSQVQKEVVDSLKVGNDALKQANALFNIEEIEKIMEETEEGIEKQREIDALLSGTLSKEDEEDAERDLAALLTTTLPEEDFIENDPTTVLPEVPTDKLQTPEPLPAEQAVEVEKDRRGSSLSPKTKEKKRSSPSKKAEKIPVIAS